MTSSEAPADTRDMYMLHTMFRREFAALPALVRGAAAGDTGRARVVTDHIEFMTAVLKGHHAAEDDHLWPKLLDRCGEETTPIVHVMEGHHARIEEFTAQTAAAVGEWRRNAASERGEALAVLLEGFTEVLYEHMSMEEQRILPLAEKYVTAGEWHAMAAASGAKMPSESMPLVFGMVRYEADPEVIETTLASVPPEVRTMLEERGSREFAAYSERIHGTAAPRRSGPLAPPR